MLSMLNQAAVEALCSATYLENYLDCMDSLPDDLQRVVSQLRELDGCTNDVMQDIHHHQDIYRKEADGAKKQRALLQIQRGLIKSQEIWDEKLQLAAMIIEHIESRTRQLDQDLENLDPTSTDLKENQIEKSKINEAKSGKVHSIAPSLAKVPAAIIPGHPRVSLDLPSTPSSSVAASQTLVKSTPPSGPSSGVGAVAAVISPPSSASSSTVLASPPAAAAASSSVASPPGDSGSKGDSLNSKVKRQRRQRTHQEANKEEEKKEEEEKQQPKKKKKRKTKKTDKSFEKTLVGEPIDPDEPTYCLCEQVSYGDMIGCDNDSCAIEWFHFNCVSLTTKPKGKWYCPKCRGDRPNVKRPDLK